MSTSSKLPVVLVLDSTGDQNDSCEFVKKILPQGINHTIIGNPRISVTDTVIEKTNTSPAIGRSKSLDLKRQADVVLIGSPPKEKNERCELTTSVDTLCVDSSRSVYNSSSETHPVVHYKRNYQTKPPLEASLKKYSMCSCENNCFQRINQMSVSEKGSIKAAFVKDRILDTKNNLLVHLNGQRQVLGYSHGSIAYKGFSYCVPAFCSLTGISNHIVRTVLDCHFRTLSTISHGNAVMPRFHSKKNVAICWFKSFCDVWTQNSPVENVVILPSFLTPTILYEIYKEENNSSECIAYSTFCKMIHDDFGPQRKDRSLPCVRLSKYSTHSICQICHDLDAFQRVCRSQQDFDLCKALKFKHKETYGRQRLYIGFLKQLSLSHPDQHVTILIDGMDQWKSNLPRFKENSKKFANFFKLPTKITGAIIVSSKYPEGNRKVKMLLNFDQFEQGSNLIVSIIFKLILTIQHDFGFLPPVLHVSVDNCWRENKVRYLLNVPIMCPDF